MYKTFDANNYLKTTLKLKDIDHVTLPFQNEIVYPSFEPQKREMISLHKNWKKVRFNNQNDFSMSKRDELWINEVKQNEIIHVDFNDANLEEHLIPSIENTATGEESIKGMEQYQDGVWYRTEIPLNIKLNKTYILKCLGLSYVGDLFINGEYVGYHEGGFTPFAFDISKYLKSGKNVLVIRVDNPKWTTRYDIIPSTNTDFFNYTGILQDIYIEVLDHVYLSRLDIVPLEPLGNVLVKAVVVNNYEVTKEVLINISINDTDYHHPLFLGSIYASDIINNKVLEQVEMVTIQAHEVKVVEFNLFIDHPNLWSIKTPNLYVGICNLTVNNVDVDQFATQFGIRSIKTKGSHILLNDKSIFIAGIARHEEWPIYGRSATWDRIKKDFLHISSLHVNFVRTAHYPNHIYTYMLLDRIGLMSAVEIPLWQFTTAHYEANEIKGLSYQMFREMVYSNYNRPSIIMWSTQNESTDVKIRKLYNERLVNEVRNHYKDLRLVTQSAAADQPGYFDESMEPMDVLGWTMYFGVFHGSTPYEGTRTFIEKAHKMWPNKPIINTEYGVWSSADDSGMEYQYKTYNDALLALIEKATVTPNGELNEKGFIAGIDYWTIYNWYVNHNSFFQTMGLYHMDRTTEKLITRKFIDDQKYLVGKSNGIAVEESITCRDKVLYSGEYNLNYPLNALTLNNVTCFDQYNYLSIKVFDYNTYEPLFVSFKTKDKTFTYETFKVRTGDIEFVNVLLKRIELDLSLVINLDIYTKANRQLKIFEVRLTNDVI
ncbi:MAG: glycoside hydrolase family 2 [Haloplasmataceae bacterium]|jgi:beta-glucuronidase|nr:glycoside hydrolase family 2 [Haloplasmataceae bacterium]